MDSDISSKYIQVEGLRIHYLVAGQGETILFLHGWPTSSYLWRNILPELSDQYQVIAVDLPGFGKSDRRSADSYSFRYYHRILSGFLEQLGIEKVTLGLHDLGGPIGLYWMIKHMDRVSRLILLNTLVYPNFSYMVKIFYLATVLPGLRHWLSSPAGIRWSMRFGVHQKEKLSPEIIQEYQSPFQDQDARKALLKSIQRLSMKGYEEIAANISAFKNPVQILYGEKDRILPRVADTMRKVQADLPQAEVMSFPECGHFLQEEIPMELGKHIKEFMNAHKTG